MTWNSGEGFIFQNIAATTDPFTLAGGEYSVTVHATFGGGSISLQRRALDALTYVNCVPAFSADGYAAADLPSGRTGLRSRPPSTATSPLC